MFAFTEQGVAMLSTVLRNEFAEQKRLAEQPRKPIGFGQLITDEVQ
jgi:hypothetical protein